jgi:hypothetical protein
MLSPHCVANPGRSNDGEVGSGAGITTLATSDGAGAIAIPAAGAAVYVAVDGPTLVGCGGRIAPQPASKARLPARDTTDERLKNLAARRLMALGWGMWIPYCQNDDARSNLRTRAIVGHRTTVEGGYGYTARR